MKKGRRSRCGNASSARPAPEGNCLLSLFLSLLNEGGVSACGHVPHYIILSCSPLYFILFLYCAAVCFVRQTAGAFAKRTGNPLGERFKIRTLQAPAVAVRLAAWAAALHKNHSSCLCSKPNSPSQSFCSHRCEMWFCECPRPFPRPPVTN